MIISHPWTTWFFFKIQPFLFWKHTFKSEMLMWLHQRFKMVHFILEGNKVRRSGARRRRSKWAVGFGSVGEKKGGKKEERMSEQKGGVRAQQGLTVPHCAQAWPVNTLGPLSALSRWTFISRGSAHQGQSSEDNSMSPNPKMSVKTIYGTVS